MPHEFNFIHKELPRSDTDLFFGPFTNHKDGGFIHIDDTTTLAHVLVHAHVFKSLTEARKNGGTGPIPPGFTHMVRGKNQGRKDIWILNKFTGWDQ